AVACMLALWCAACWISCANALPVVAPSMRRMTTASVQAIGLSSDRIIGQLYREILCASYPAELDAVNSRRPPLLCPGQPSYPFCPNTGVRGITRALRLG